ncbi:MAG: protealysin inhibitor emfourin [Anaerolineae bacterium]
MRSVLFAAALCVLVLAACSRPPEPTATPVPPTTAPTTDIIVNNDLSTLAATVGAPAPGTLVISDAQETPNAPTEAPIALDSLFFTQTGGIAGISLTIQLSGDGTLIRDGETSTVSADEVARVTALLDAVHFFSLQGIFSGPGSAADAYRYSLTVNGANGSRTITSDDGMTPPELYQVYDAVRNLGSGS